MTNFPDDTFLKEAKAAMTEWERKKKEKQERKDAVKKEYQRVITSGKNMVNSAMVQTAQTLREAVLEQAFRPNARREAKRIHL